MFKVEILLPERIFFSTEVNIAILEAEDGEVGILKNHAPFITLLKKKAEIKLGDKTFLVCNGHAHFVNNLLKITCTDFIS